MKRVFSKEKFIEVEGIEDYEQLEKNSKGNNWVDECDGLTPEEMIREKRCLAVSDWLVEIEEKMTKKDLQFGDIITTRNGERYVVADNSLFGEKSYDLDCERIEDVYDDDLNGCYYDEEYDDEDNKGYDVMKVERKGNLIYTRKENEKNEVKEMTVAEISKALGYEVKVVK